MGQAATQARARSSEMEPWRLGDGPRLGSQRKVQPDPSDDSSSSRIVGNRAILIVSIYDADEVHHDLLRIAMRFRLPYPWPSAFKHVLTRPRVIGIPMESRVDDVTPLHDVPVAVQERTRVVGAPNHALAPESRWVQGGASRHPCSSSRHSDSKEPLGSGWGKPPPELELAPPSRMR